MSVILRNIQIPLFIKVEHGVLGKIRAILEEHHLHFQKPLILSEGHILELGGADVVHSLDDAPITLLNDNSIADGDALAAEIKKKGNDVLVSIGGGRVIDLGKYAATKAQVNYISVPTSPSNDGICSPGAVLKNGNGGTENIPVNMPIGVLVDTSMMTSAPVDNIRAGVGDLISNFSAIRDWKLAANDGKERMDDFAASLAQSGAQIVYETCASQEVDLQEETFLEKLVQGLILSGIAMNIAGNSRPASGSEHKISHAIDELFPGTALHGIQVALGTVFTTFLHNDSIDHLVRLFRKLALPLTPSDIGLSDEQFSQALLHAPETRSGRYTILEKLNMNTDATNESIKQYHELLAKLT